MLKDSSTYFHTFSKSIDKIELPANFTFPFYYIPHPLVELAASQLQNFISDHSELSIQFDLDSEGAIGKMFGVLVVQSEGGDIGFLAAFSGRLSDSYLIDGFVPPLYDNAAEHSFYRIEENNISNLTTKLSKLESDTEFITAQDRLQEAEGKREQAILSAKAEFSIARKERRKLRASAKLNLSEEDYTILHSEHRRLSYHQQHQIKLLDEEWKEKLHPLEAKVEGYRESIRRIKEERKQRSNALQHRLFDQYNFLNGKGNAKSLIDIFQEVAGKLPPSAAGDCAAPKLLQYAFENKLKPICMGEFWWGKVTTAEVRKHGYFYPSCRGKCEPILGHMLQGLQVDSNPMLDDLSESKTIEVIYEDQALAIIVKPAEFLSVPGKSIDDSVYLRMKLRYPAATGPLIVHRLDMSTSGLMIIAKTKESHKKLQREFIRKKVVKRYTAILDGLLDSDQGEVILPIRVDLNNRPRQLVCYEYGKMAHTRYEVVAVKNSKTKVHFFPITGRTHQLRVHSAHNSGLKTPILGDDLYGKTANRLHLHAAYIKFQHPLTGAFVEFHSQDDFSGF